MIKLDQEYWSNRYSESRTGWDIGHPGPLSVILDKLTDKKLNILIPGCGNGYEAEYALQNGFKNVVMIDISKRPLQNLANRCPLFPAENLIHEDFFDHTGNYDVILEQTFFCALQPELRTAYVNKMSRLLNPNGIITGVLFDIPLESGPPFGGDSSLYKSLFSSKFEIDKLEPCQFSIKQRLGSELYFEFKKK